MDDNEVGQMALLGDVWYEILNVNVVGGVKEYTLSSKDYLIPSTWIKEIKPKEILRQ